jgi:hypothetical protein
MISKLLPFIAIAASIGLFFMYINPTYTGTIKSLGDEVSQYQSALQASDVYKARETALTAQRDVVPADDLAKLSAFLPDGVDNVQLILDLNALASRSGVSLSDFKIGDNASKSQGSGSALKVDSPSVVDSLDLSVSADGTYASFRSFLTGIESSLRPLDVVNVDLKSSDTGVYKYAVTLRIYWLR